MDGRNLDERINWGAIPQIAEVKLTCDEFTLTRTIKPTTTSHLLVGPNLKLTKKSEINDYIFKLWNIQSVNQLKDVFFAAQLKATELFDATDAVRLGMLSKLFGFDRLEKGRTAIYNVLSSTAIPTVNEERIFQLEDELAVLVDQTTKASDDFEKAEATVAEINFDKEEYDRVMAAPLDSQRDLLENELNDKRNLRYDLQREFDKVTVLTDAKQTLENQLKGFDAYHQYKEAEDSLLATLHSFDDGGPSAAAVYAAMQELDKRMLPILTEMKDLQKNLDVDANMCPLTGGAACIDFLRMHDPETIKARQDELKKQQEELLRDAQQLKDLLNERTEHELAASKVKAELDALQKNAPQIVDALTDEQLKELEGINDKLSVCEEQNPDKIAGAIKTCDQRISEIERQLAVATEAVTEDDKRHQQELFAKFTEASSKLSVASAKLQQLVDSSAATGKLLNGLRKDAKEAADIQHRADVLRLVRDILSRDQLQRVLLQSTIKRINAEIEVCAKIFSFPFHIRVEDNGSISFSTDDAEGKNVAFLSGGQKYVAAVIVRLAFSRVLRSKFPFVVLDEPSTCLDDNSREMLAELMAAMAHRAKDSGLCLLVPTHDQLIVDVSTKIVNTGD